MSEHKSSRLSVNSGLLESLGRRASFHRRPSSSSATSAGQPASVVEGFRQISEAIAAAPSPASSSGLFPRAERRSGSLDSQNGPSLSEQSLMMPSPTPLRIKSTQGDQPTLSIGFCPLTLGTGGAPCGVVERTNWPEAHFPAANSDAADRDMQTFHALLDEISRGEWDARTSEEKVRCLLPPPATSVSANVLDSSIPQGPVSGPAERFNPRHEYERLLANFKAAKTAFQQLRGDSSSRSSADTLRVNLIDPGDTAYLYALHTMEKEGRVVPLAEMVTPEWLYDRKPWFEDLSDFHYGGDCGKLAW